ncbi:methyltransferase domain-containing protein [Thiocapsa roseopersicina]|uniref:Ubiquinone/menaquinone biosynthesis C-methylase UbiE n=1 Tax=Thiocapsa roseopersicina TaxID=1058 RepID=A0A1H2QIA7_THIRO|nr:methyltransferase domain-containing protein [Thiocapsa roseopersicina]SDW06943.1 Ubiquinone/menaquinone biosynthesis C-methylase UbiE [Thiocapsa roseopersicina]
MSTARPFRRHLAYLDWLYNPFRSWDVTRVYDLLSTDVATEKGLYLNLGYWAGEQTLDEACQALAALVAERAAMRPGDRVLDVGFGFGDQDLYWLQTYRPDHIQGLNITASQVAVARGRIADLGLEERIDLREGSATEMPLPSNSVDTVVALECAFHFKTRERFFEEAFRVLRPGGRLVTADIIPMPLSDDWRTRLKQRWSWRLVASKFAIPAENVYTRDIYVEKLEACGFGDVEVASIRDLVYTPLHDYLSRHPETLDRLHPATRLPARLALAMSAESVYGGLDYVLSTAQKPI